jgi:hypothetical protein
MYPTAEVRWFVEAPLPEAAIAWFHGVAGANPWEGRIDHYVRPASPDGLGVKGRTGNLEVKRLAEVVGTESLGSGVVGRVEYWRKWSFPLGPEAVLRNGAGDWVAVGKRRQKGTFAVHGDRIERVQREEQAGQGCSLEIAEVTAEARAWWSVSFEAFGSYDQAALVDYLRRAARHVFTQTPPFELSAKRSMSYPAWLWDLARGTDGSGVK